MQILNDKELLGFVGKQESQYLVRPSELMDKVKERLSGDGRVFGDKLPWSKTHNCVGLRKGEVSVWAGINGHGKSQLLGQVCAWNLNEKKWLIASMEMLPEATMERMSRQCSGVNYPSDSYLEGLLRWTDDKLWIYDQTDTVKTDRILAVMHYASEVLGINHIVIDSLMKCGIKKDDLNTQAEFVDKLCWMAKSTGCHIHLVHHIRKGDKESGIPDKFDIRGAGEVTDMVDNVFIIHRNKKKEAETAMGNENVSDPDCRLIVAKQRNGEWEGSFKLWFNQSNKQYVPTPDKRTMSYYL